MAKKGDVRRAKTGRSLNLIVWLVFSAFAIVVVAVCVLMQNVLVGRNYRAHAYETLNSAQERIAAAISEAAESGAADREIISVATEEGVSAYLVYDDVGEAVALNGETRAFKAFGDLAALMQDGGTRCFVADDEIACVAAVNYGGRAGYSYLAVSLSPLWEYESMYRMTSLVTGLVAVVLAFVVSGFVALFITKPVTEVTERAKELARGNYDVDFGKKYFCLEVDELSSALEYARTEISRADKVQKELIANVSHDFKTPLTMIKAYASMIREISGDNKEKRDAHAQIIIDEADRLTALVSDVLDLSKLRAGVEEESVLFDFSAETRAIVARFDYLHDTQGYEIELSAEDGIEIVAGRARMGQVVYNLVGNAVNYTGEDKRVRVKLFRKDGAARLEVIDSGKGIPPEEADTIWDRYYRSEASHRRPVQGTGLGLSIVKSVLLLYNFPFGVISEQGKGSCFWVEIPLAGDGVSAGEKEEEA